MWKEFGKFRNRVRESLKCYKQSPADNFSQSSDSHNADRNANCEGQNQEVLDREEDFTVKARHVKHTVYLLILCYDFV